MAQGVVGLSFRDTWGKSRLMRWDFAAARCGDCDASFSLTMGMCRQALQLSLLSSQLSYWGFPHLVLLRGSSISPCPNISPPSPFLMSRLQIAGHPSVASHLNKLYGVLNGIDQVGSWRLARKVKDSTFFPFFSCACESIEDDPFILFYTENQLHPVMLNNSRSILVSPIRGRGLPTRCNALHLAGVYP